MFIVERQSSGLIVSSCPENAVQKYRQQLTQDKDDNSYYNVWDTAKESFYVIRHNADFDPICPDSKEFEKIVHFNRAEREKLIEEMIHKAHCDEGVLRQLCEMAAMQINAESMYKNWVPEDGDAPNT